MALKTLAAPACAHLLDWPASNRPIPDAAAPGGLKTCSPLAPGWRRGFAIYNLPQPAIPKSPPAPPPPPPGPPRWTARQGPPPPRPPTLAPPPAAAPSEPLMTLYLTDQLPPD